MRLDTIPLITFHQRVLDPLIIVATFFGFSALLHIPFSGPYLILIILCLFISSAIYKQIDPYRAWRNGRLLSYVGDILVGWLITVMVMIFLGNVSGFDTHFSSFLIKEWFFTTPLLLLLVHLVEFKYTARAIHNQQIRSVIIIGANKNGLKLSRCIKKNPNLSMRVKGFFDDRTSVRFPDGMREHILGKNDDVAAYVRKENINLIFISQPLSEQPRIRKLIEECKDTTASIYFLPDIYIFDLIQARFDNIAGIPIVAVCETPFIGDNSLIKRASDLVFLLLLLPFLLPVMLIVAILVKATSKGPIIFKQRRYGLDGREILVYKFRSMTVTEDSDVVVQAKKNDHRLTPIGGFLRRSSLDELPQFINVLEGNMSIVGPRPHAVTHNEQYRKLISGYMLRHKVKPGITGWAQVNGMRGETETIDKMQARIDFDLNYLRNWSIWLDLWIILYTVKVVIKGNNAH